MEVFFVWDFLVWFSGGWGFFCFPGVFTAKTP